VAGGRAAAPRGTRFDALAPASASARALGWLIGRLGVAARAAAIARLQGKGGGLVLELGIAAGASLGRYRRDVNLIGIDWRYGALRIAAARGARRGLLSRHRVLGGVALADPAALPFQAGSFDGALAAFCVARLARPAQALDELARVVRPGGDIVLVDRFAERAGAGDGLAGLAMLMAVPGLAMTTMRRLPPCGLFTLVCLRVERGPAGSHDAAGTAWPPSGIPPAARRRRLARRRGAGRHARPARARRLTG
jgi:phosphatidylethanolamine/phosphatidyl-N-methylethanolamine N-methyltransferase